MPLIPDGLLAALNNALQAKSDAELSDAAKTASATALVSAQQADQAAAADLAAKTASLASARAALEAVEEQFLVVGGTLPVAPPPAPPVTPS